jgi:hypothetical protein
LQNAPEFVLDIFDHPQFDDRYTIMLTGSALNTDGTYAGTYISYVASSEYGSTYFGEFKAWEAASYRYGQKHRRIRWDSLPDAVKKAVISRVTED